MAFVQEKDGVATGGAIVSLTLAMLVERCSAEFRKTSAEFRKSLSLTIHIRWQGDNH